MKTSHQIRLDNLELLLQEFGSLEAIAEKCELNSAVYLSQLKSRQPDTKTGKPRNMGNQTARKLEHGCQKPGGWMDTDHSESLSNVSEGPSIKGKVPLISWVQAGEWCDVEVPYDLGGVEEWYPCTDKHGSRTYALRVDGESMFDPSGPISFSNGEIIFIDPDREPIHNSLVIACESNSNRATFKKLIIEGGKKYLKALNPDWPDKIIEVKEDTHLCGVVISKYQSFV